MGVADLLNNLEPQQSAGEVAIWLQLPAGYLPLPIEDSAERLAEVEPVLAELCPPENEDLLYATLNTFATLLAELDQRNAVYCGLGWHTAPDESVVSSTLVISVQPTGEERNPKLVLGDLVHAAANAGDHAQADLVDLTGGPALFFERVRSLPKPSLPGQQGDPGRADVYQLEAIVVSEKGDLLAALEFSTPYVQSGTLFREMMVLLANSVSFTPPPASEDASASARQIHHLLGGLDA
ncbi:hypothetical protein [Actinospica robiniae]|uniref:hypothetical protein n=1 Tax=Actinospica robiniae TaxID=304901 RepID=UPI000428C575|nr:hypothetical protein [Actinospica robiniae]